jgi:tetratricopeptide (TPR) repeat protein
MGNGWNAKGLKKAKLGHWQDALNCWDNALEIRIQVLGTQHLDVANTFNNRGIALGKLHRFEAALSSLEQALQIRKLRLGAQDSQVAATMHNLANVHHQAGDLQGAILLLAQCKGIYIQHIRTTAKSTISTAAVTSQQSQDIIKSQQQLARAMVAMGHLYWEASHYTDATQAYLDALTIYKIHLGTVEEDHHVQEIRQDLQQLSLLNTKNMTSTATATAQSQISWIRHDQPTFKTTNMMLATQQAA